MAQGPKNGRASGRLLGPATSPDGTGKMSEQRCLMSKRKHTKGATPPRRERTATHPSLPDGQTGTVENDPLIGHLVRAELATVAPRPGYLRGLATAENRPKVAERLRALAYSIKRINQ
jgi:hypothetical protein